MRSQPVGGLSALLVACLVIGSAAGLTLAYEHRATNSAIAVLAPEVGIAPSAPTIDPGALDVPLPALTAHAVVGPRVFVIEAATMQTVMQGTTGHVEFDKVSGTVLAVDRDANKRVAGRVKMADFLAKWGQLARGSIVVDEGTGSAPFVMAKPAYDAKTSILQFDVSKLDAPTIAWLRTHDGAKAVTLFGNITDDCLSPHAQYCSYAPLRARNLAGHDFRLADLYRADFEGAQLGGANFTGAWVAGADFSIASAPHSQFVAVNPNLETTSETRFDLATLTPGVVFSGALQGASFFHARLSGATFTGAHLNSARFVGADLTNADLSHADLTNADFDGAALVGARLDGANLTGAHLENADISHASLSHANLTNATLSHAALEHASLVDANLHGTQLPSANLVGAELAGATMYGADLSHAILLDADLGALASPVIALGDEWSAAASYFPTMLDMAGYTCGTDLPDGTYDDADCQYEPSAFPAIAAAAAATVREPTKVIAQTRGALRDEVQELLG